jgi:hypothetical protein
MFKNLKHTIKTHIGKWVKILIIDYGDNFS